MIQTCPFLLGNLPADCSTATQNESESVQPTPAESLPKAESPSSTKAASEQNPNSSDMSAEFAKFAEAASKSAAEAPSDAAFAECLAETMRQLSQNNEQLKVMTSLMTVEKKFLISIFFFYD